jgi:hypothetical protein
MRHRLLPLAAFFDYTLLPYSPPTITANYISIVNGVTADFFAALQIFAAEEVAPRVAILDESSPRRVAGEAPL